MRSGLRAGTAALVAVGVVAACSSSPPKPTTAKTTPTTSPSPATSAVAAPGPPSSFTELASLFVTKVPAGFALQADRVGDAGPSDLAKAVKDDGAADAGTSLRTEGFVRGYKKLWVNPAHDEIIVFVYQFESATGAHQDYARGTRGYAGQPPPGVNVHKFTVPGLPASQALGVAGTEQGTSVAVTYFTTGVFNVQIDCDARKLAGLQERVTAIARDQFRRLQPS